MSELFRSVEGGSLIVKVADFRGSFEISCRSDILRSILTTGKYEPEMVELVGKLLDARRDAIDVGANAGLFTVFMANITSASSRVLAVEPTAGALKYLYGNIERNDCQSKVIVFEGVASKSCGQLALNVIAGREEFSTLGNLVHPSTRNQPHRTVPTPSKTIDVLVEEFSLNPGLIKVDTEGSEHDVLMGCEKTLLKHRPVVLCEAWEEDLITQSGRSPDGVAKLLKSWNYTLSRPIRGELLAIPTEQALAQTP